MALPFNRVNGPKEAGTTTCTIDGAFAAKVAGDVAIQIACCICSVSALNASDASSVTLDDDEVVVGVAPETWLSWRDQPIREARYSPCRPLRRRFARGG